MVDRWPKGSRPPRPGSRGWLLDNRGRQYRLGNTVAFHVYFQPAEGKLWNRLYRDGMPLRLSALVSRTEFIEEVGNRDGAYQLQPVDADERPIGDPPSMVFLPPPQTAPQPARDPIMSPREPIAEAADAGLADSGLADSGLADTGTDALLTDAAISAAISNAVISDAVLADAALADARPVDIDAL